MNSFGRLFKVSIFGESHGEFVGILIDGVPPGIKLTKDCFKEDLERRKPNKKGTTKRVETDEILIQSGVFNDHTTGAPILLMFENMNVKSSDYSEFLNTHRPSHSDFTYKTKYNNFNDYRGGGHSSGRLTVAITAAGVIAKKITNYLYSTKIINLNGNDNTECFDEIIDEALKNQDSVGGIVETVVKNVEIGLGEPFFDSVESIISHLLFSVGGVKGVSFGIGFEGVDLYGSEFNDVYVNKDGKTKTNNSGGINGGISNGNEIVVKTFVKPTSSIKKNQETLNFKTNKMDVLSIDGRHDAAIIIRAQVVIEAMIAIALADLYLTNKSYS